MDTMTSVCKLLSRRVVKTDRNLGVLPLSCPGWSQIWLTISGEDRPRP
jgi:hypothetical protein